jgi:hypothetical protein
MNRRCLLFLALCGILSFAPAVQAQISVRFALDRSSYLQFEHIYAQVELRNYSGRTVVFGQSEDLQGGLEFWIDGPNGERVALRESAFNPVQSLIIKPGATEKVVVPLSRLYLVKLVGSYSAKAVIRHRMFPATYESNTLNFTVVNGMPVWERIIGVPDIMLKANEKVVATRRARVVTFYDGINKVYSLIMDDDTYIYGVVRLGHDIGHFPPQCEVDGLSRVHILIQVSPQVFSYYLFDFNADLDEKEVYLRDGVSPQLVRDAEEGTVLVAGGRKAVKNVDYVEKDGMPVPPPAKPDPDAEPRSQPGPEPAAEPALVPEAAPMPAAL